MAVALPALFSGRAAAQSFETTYPNVISLALNNRTISELKVSYVGLRQNSGWGVLSKSLYGTDEYANNLRKLNSNAASPMATNSWLAGILCDWISDKYCAPRVIVRDPKSKVEAPKPEPIPTVSASSTKPKVVPSGPIHKKPPAPSASSSGKVPVAPPEDEDE
ncbi:MAG: hypothetical protein WC624_04600 [Candidatus Margulisiibacteriota bacterium]